jgi:hypothetical protein
MFANRVLSPEIIQSLHDGNPCAWCGFIGLLLAGIAAVIILRRRRKNKNDSEK